MNEYTKKGMNRRTRNWIIVVLALIIVAAGGYYIYQSRTTSNGNGLSGYVLGEGTLPGLTDEEIQEMLNRQVDESTISFTINGMPVFKGKEGSILFANPPYNAHDLDLTIILDGEEIVKTGKIKPNQYIDKIELLGSPLKKGEYKATGIITGYNQETGEEVGKANVALDITVE